jgi:hypothetical protein
VDGLGSRDEEVREFNFHLQQKLTIRRKTT